MTSGGILLNPDYIENRNWYLDERPPHMSEPGAGGHSSRSFHVSGFGPPIVASDWTVSYRKLYYTQHFVLK
jgi:hypothetical protein